MREELNEVTHAMYHEPIDHLAKELADLLYTVLGTIEAFGLSSSFEDVFQAVHKSNMSKFTQEGLRLDVHGKVMKSDQYQPPDIKSILER